MSEAIIVAIITGGLALIGSIVGQSIGAAKQTSELINAVKNASDVSDAEIKGEIAVIKTEITDLKEETRKHNQVIERTYQLEQRSAVHEEQIKVANHRIEDLEKKTAG